MLRFFASLSLLALVACQPAPVGVRNLSVAPDSAPQCASLCQQVGMSLDSLVIMADNVGCVCRAVPPAAPPGAMPAPAQAATTGAASAGGMAAILLQRQAQQAAAQRSAAQRK